MKEITIKLNLEDYELLERITNAMNEENDSDFEMRHVAAGALNAKLSEMSLRWLTEEDN